MLLFKCIHQQEYLVFLRYHSEGRNGSATKAPLVNQSLCVTSASWLSGGATSDPSTSKYRNQPNILHSKGFHSSPPAPTLKLPKQEPYSTFSPTIITPSPNVRRGRGRYLSFQGHFRHEFLEGHLVVLSRNPADSSPL